MVAFERAVHTGARVIELDVSLTADDELVVIHDESLLRTTGCDRLVRDLSTEQIAELDAGSWFAPEFRDERIPLFDDVLAWSRDHVFLNVDTKCHVVLDPPGHAERLAERLVASVTAASAEKRLVIQCADHQLAALVKSLAPDMFVGVTQHGRPVDIVAIARAADASLVSTDTWHTDENMVRAPHAAGIGVMTSVELPHHFPRTDMVSFVRANTERLIDIGVDIVVSDDIASTLQVVQNSCPNVLTSHWTADGRRT
jgi:glycerophosphoryl diester phosphodiesterase